MSHESRKITLAAFLSLLLVTGCSSVIPGTQGSTSAGFEQTQLAGLTFSKVSDKNATLLNNVQQGNTQTAQTGGQPLSAPAVAASEPQKSEIAPANNSVSGATGQASTAVRTDMAIAPASKMSSPYIGYFPSAGPFEEYVMINFEEATSPGFTGTYLETLIKVVKPVITAWSKDARQTAVNGSTDPNGKNLNVDPPVSPYNYYSPFQWQFTYISVSKKEVYNIFVSSAQTLVLRQKWVLKDLNPDETKIDSNQAIKIVTDKIADKTYNSPDNQPQYRSPNSEILYSIPEKATWYFYLSQEKEGLIWNVNFNIYNQSSGIAIPMAGPADAGVATAISGGGSAGSSAGSPGVATPVPQQTSTYIWYSGGYARINAKTGEILSLSRPVKYTETYYPYYPETKTCDVQGNCTVSASTPASPPSVTATSADALLKK